MKSKLTPVLLLAALLALGLLTACHRHTHAALDVSESAEPDKVLYDRSIEDIKNKRFDVARLTLQTLLNTYPDSEYLSAAKLGIADSYFQEGASGALTSAEVEYKDFITFFPNDPQVAFAQYRAALCNYRRLEKPDRDRTFARRAEREFQLLLLNYPESEYAAEGEKKLIAVQEVLAEGEFRIANFYYRRESWRAGAARLTQLIERYPNYSQRDQALWMLAQSYEKEIPYFWLPDPKRAAESYARLVREHPTSPYGADAKEQLARLGQPIPEPDPVLLARAQNIQPVGEEAEGEHRGLLGHMFGLFSSRPDVSEAAARLGPPPLGPPQETRRIPPPPFAASQRGSSVAVQTREDLPAGTVVQTPPGTTDASGRPAEQPPQAQAEGEKPAGPPAPPPKKKKSFWRKLFPF